MGRITTDKNMIWLGRNPKCIYPTEEYEPFWYSTAGDMEICAVVVASSAEQAVEVLNQQHEEDKNTLPRSEWNWEAIGEPSDATERIIILAYGEF